MSRWRTSFAVVALVVTLAPAARARTAERAPFVGLSLVEAIERLEAAGLTILYSSDLVRPDMRIAAEPAGRWPREILDEILAPHDLNAQTGPAGTTLIVAAPVPGRSAASWCSPVRIGRSAASACRPRMARSRR